MTCAHCGTALASDLRCPRCQRDGLTDELVRVDRLRGARDLWFQRWLQFLYREAQGGRLPVGHALAAEDALPATPAKPRLSDAEWNRRLWWMIAVLAIAIGALVSFHP